MMEQLLEVLCMLAGDWWNNPDADKRRMSNDVIRDVLADVREADRATANWLLTELLRVTSDWLCAISQP